METVFDHYYIKTHFCTRKCTKKKKKIKKKNKNKENATDVANFQCLKIFREAMSATLFLKIQFPGQ